MLSFLGLMIIIGDDQISRLAFYLGCAVSLYVLFSDNTLKSGLLHPASLIGLAFIVYSVCTLFWGSGTELSHYIRWGFGLAGFWISLIIICQSPDETVIVRTATGLQLIIIIACTYTILHYLLSSTEPFRNQGPGILQQVILGPSVTIAVSAVSVMLLGMLNRGNNLLTFILIICVTAYTLTTSSRGPLLADGVWISSLLILQHNHVKRNLTVVCCLVAGFAIFFSFEPGYFQSLIARGGSNRLEIWKATLPVLQNNLFFGNGINANFMNSSAEAILLDITNEHIVHPHNLGLSTVFYSGLFGLIFLLATTAVAIYYALAYRLSSFKHYAPIVLAIFCVTLTDTHTLIMSPAPIWFIFWQPSAMLAGMSIRLVQLHFRH